MLQVSKAIKGEKEEDETEPDSSAENGDRKVGKIFSLHIFIHKLEHFCT
jgi:hypothetical protein